MSSPCRTVRSVRARCGGSAETGCRVEVRAFGSRGARDAATDEMALDGWLHWGNGPGGLPAAGTAADGIPACFRGPYRPS
ncbi:hypothetical protein AB0H73_10140 [Streptomyces olivoreticuli]